MPGEHVQALVNAALDGELDDAGQAEFKKLLEHSAEAREYYADMQDFAALINRVPAVEPPNALRREILSNIKLGAAAPTGRDTGGFRLFPMRKAAEMGLSFAAGALLAVGFYAAVDKAGGPGDLDQLVGTMVDPERASAPARLISIDAQDITGEARLSSVNGLYVLEFNLDSPTPYELSVNLAGQALQFRGFVRAESTSRLAESTESRLRVSGQGESHFSLALGHDQVRHQGIEFEVLASGERLFKGNFDAAQ